MQRSAERKFNRHRNFNYSLPGFYYVTICTQNWIRWFGRIDNQRIILNSYGNIAESCWLNIPEHFDPVLLDEFIIMPNHIHGIIQLTAPIRVGDAYMRPLPVKNFGVPRIVQEFKSATTRIIRNNFFCWQRSFYDRVLRDQDELEHARWYVRNNPRNWNYEKSNPTNG